MKPLKIKLGFYDFEQQGIKQKFLIVPGQSIHGKLPYEVFFNTDIRGHLLNLDGLEDLIKNFGARKREESFINNPKWKIEITKTSYS